MVLKGIFLSFIRHSVFDGLYVRLLANPSGEIASLKSSFSIVISSLIFCPGREHERIIAGIKIKKGSGSFIAK
jgi:hypothetical protein